MKWFFGGILVLLVAIFAALSTEVGQTILNEAKLQASCETAQTPIIGTDAAEAVCSCWTARMTSKHTFEDLRKLTSEPTLLDMTDTYPRLLESSIQNMTACIDQET